MEKAKQVVQNLVSKDGKHKTTVDEDIRKPVTSEHVRPHQHEDITTAVDKDIHQDHHHTTIQPLAAKERLPEKHTGNILPVEHRTFEHANSDEDREALQRDAAKYNDKTYSHDTTASTSTAPAVTSERVHHHVHEHVQPVIEKETIAPEVVHTTVPVHETHHATPIFHGTSVLPAKSIGEYTTENGSMQGRATTKISEADGCPRTYRKDLQVEQFDADKNLHGETATGRVGSQKNSLEHSDSGLKANRSS